MTSDQKWDWTANLAWSSLAFNLWPAVTCQYIAQLCFQSQLPWWLPSWIVLRMVHSTKTQQDWVLRTQQMPGVCCLSPESASNWCFYALLIPEANPVPSWEKWMSKLQASVYDPPSNHCHDGLCHRRLKTASWQCPINSITSYRPREASLEGGCWKVRLGMWWKYWDIQGNGFFQLSM